jgi:peroxiredoxin
VSFPVLGKVEVNGDKADPVYNYLKNSKSGFLGLTRIKYVQYQRR